MRMETFGGLVGAAALVVTMAAAPAVAAPVFWTDWTSAVGNDAFGSLQIGATTIDVQSNSTGGYAFVQTGAGTNYWVPSGPYLSATVDNAPPASDIVALNTGGTITITFSETVLDPLIALVSWNNNTVEFGVPIEVLSFGAGFWGNGTPIVNATGTGFFGSGEVHGVIRLPGAFDSFSFTHTSENWHGFTIGAVGQATPAPLPNALTFLGVGLLGLGVALRRRAA